MRTWPIECCHRALDYKKPKNWKAIHLECSKCFGSKVICRFHIGYPPPLKIWVCRSCFDAQPDIREIIESHSMKVLP